MEPVVLYTSTGNQQVDDILRGTLGILEATFPERIRSYYLHGSFADHNGIATSDIDVFVIPKGKFNAEEHEKMRYIMSSCSLFSPFMVEVIVLDEERLLQNGHFRVKSASQLLLGEDLCERIPEQTLDQYLQIYAHFPALYFTQMIRSRNNVVFPLSYPLPAGDFYGYDQLRLPPRGERQHNIKKMVTGVCWAATVLIAWQAGKTVEGKRASVQLYREYVNDKWTSFIEELYEWGNRQWHYLVPSEPEARQLLRDLCAQTLAFENHYFSHYKSYLLSELQGSGERKMFAVQQLKTITYTDEECYTALRSIECGDDKEMRRSVEEILQKMEVVRRRTTTRQTL